MDKRAHLQLGLEEELLWALRAVVDLVLLPVHSKDVLLQLVGLDEDWTWTRTWLSADTGDTSTATHSSCPTPLASGGHPGMDAGAKHGLFGASRAPPGESSSQ